MNSSQLQKSSPTGYKKKLPNKNEVLTKKIVQGSFRI